MTMNKQWSIGILVFDKVDAFDFVGPSEILSIARYSEEDVQNMLLGKGEEKTNPFLTAQGPDAGIHLAFHLVKRFMGVKAGLMAADTLEFDGLITLSHNALRIPLIEERENI